MVKFKIVENAPEKYLEHYEDFIFLYNNTSMKVKDICKKFDWNSKDYLKARNHALSKGEIISRKSFLVNKKKVKKSNRWSPDYYSRDRNTGKFRVIKKLNNECLYFGTYSDEDAAREVVKRLKQCDWNVEKYPQIKEDVIAKYGL